MKETNVRDYNIGKSDYAEHIIQPWDIWISFRLDPFRADLVKRLLRKKAEPGMTETQSRIMDYEKIKHITSEIQRQQDLGITWLSLPMANDNVPVITVAEIVMEYKLDSMDSILISAFLSGGELDCKMVAEVCDIQINKLKSKESV